MKQPRTAYGFYTEHDAKTNQWSTYAIRKDDDQEPVGKDCYAATPEESLDAAMRMSEDVDDGRCKHGRWWCDDCDEEDAAEGALG